MKKLTLSSFLLNVLLVAAMTTVSCVSSIPLSTRLSNVIEQVETSEYISDEEWEEIKEEYFMLVDEFRVNIDIYTEEERTEIYEQIGRMNGVLVKREANSIVSSLKELNNSLPSIVQGFMEGFVSE